jgi:transposase
MSAYSLHLREKIVESVKKGVSKSETARRFGVDRATVKRYCKQLDERGTLEPRKAPGKIPKLDEKAAKLLAKDLEERPWATHSQRAEFLFALSWQQESNPSRTCRMARARGIDNPLGKVEKEAWKTLKDSLQANS